MTRVTDQGVSKLQAGQPYAIPEGVAMVLRDLDGEPVETLVWTRDEWAAMVRGERATLCGDDARAVVRDGGG